MTSLTVIQGPLTFEIKVIVPLEVLDDVRLIGEYVKGSLPPSSIEGDIARLIWIKGHYLGDEPTSVLVLLIQLALLQILLSNLP